MKRQKIGHGAIYLYIEGMIAMLSGYFFWLLMSNLTSPAEIGISSTVVSISGIFATLSALGIPTGAQRFLGKHFVEGNHKAIRSIVRACLFLTSIALVGSLVILYFMTDYFFLSLGIDYMMLIMIISLSSSTCLSLVLRSIAVSSLDTKVIATSTIIASVARFVISLILVGYGFGALGILIGFCSFPVIFTLIVSSSLFSFLHGKRTGPSIWDTSKAILSSSMAFWVPSLISTIGYQLGTIVVFGTNGPEEAGQYFIAVSLVTALSLVSTVLTAVSFPSISALSDGRKRFVLQMLRVTLFLTLPFSSAFVFYPDEILGLFGSEYRVASLTLQILTISLLPTSIQSLISVLSYAYNKNIQILIISLGLNIPKTFLYLLLSPAFGSDGAAIGYLVGSIIGCIISLWVARKLQLSLPWKPIALTFLIPMFICYLLEITKINYILAILIMLLVSYASFYRLHIINKADISIILELLPRRISSEASSLLNRLNKDKD